MLEAIWWRIREKILCIFARLLSGHGEHVEDHFVENPRKRSFARYQVVTCKKVQYFVLYKHTCERDRKTK